MLIMKMIKFPDGSGLIELSKNLALLLRGVALDCVDGSGASE
jgi:hypothetical protein